MKRLPKILTSLTSVLILQAIGAAQALAQEAPATAPATAAPTEAPAVPAEATMSTTATTEAPAAAETAPPEATATEAEKREEPAPPPAPLEEVATRMEKTMNIGLWGRVDLILNDGGKKLNDVSSNGVFEFHVGGSVHKYVNYTANLVATYGGGSGTIMGTAGLLDGIVQFDLSDAFNVWVGRMLVPSDRANFSGTWFAAPWFYPGSVANVGGAPLYGPRQGPFGRNDGVTVWGQAGGGMFKYYVSAFDLYDVADNPLISARVNVSLLNPEPGFYHSSTYYGKDILAIGAHIQSKKDGSVDATSGATDDYMGFGADVLFEKDLKESGVFDAEAGFYKFDGDAEAVDTAFYGLASYLLPGEVGIGKLQPLVRVQQVKPAASGADNITIIEGQVGYVIDAYAARLALGFQHAGNMGPGGDGINAIYLGAQIEK